jgi:hypothetical protein
MTVRLPPANLTLDRAGKVRNIYYARIPVSHTIEDVLDPDYFGQLMGNKALTPGDRIECEAENFSWDVELRVHAQSPSTQQLIARVVREYRTYLAGDLPPGWTTQWLGGAEHYGILLNDKMVEQGLVSMDDCLNRINAIVATDRHASAARAATRASAPDSKRAKAEKSEAA